MENYLPSLFSLPSGTPSYSTTSTVNEAPPSLEIKSLYLSTNALSHVEFCLMQFSSFRPVRCFQLSKSVK